MTDYCAKVIFSLFYFSHQKLDFVDVATGSLGQGLGAACGMAYTGKNFDKSRLVFAKMCKFNCHENLSKAQLPLCILPRTTSNSNLTRTCPVMSIHVPAMRNTTTITNQSIL